MINELIAYLKNKKILILGFEREGKSTYALIQKYLPNQPIYVADKKTTLDYQFSDNTVLCCGEHYLDNLEQYDMIIKSPGVTLKNILLDKMKDKITSQLELLLDFFPVYTIGITGTKGKSTTSTLIYQVLLDQGKDVLLMGNIGVPVFEHLEEIKENMYLVLEMSSHQLQFMRKSPKISILLNVYEEHLDHYSSFDEYIEAKCNIFKYQNADDFTIYNSDSELIQNKIQEIKPKSNLYAICMNTDLKEKNVNLREKIVSLKDQYVYIDKTKSYDSTQERKLIGDHNLNDIMFVLTVARILNLDMSQASQTINRFQGLPHRMELVGTYNDITYYDDSISTIPMACINAIEGLKNVSTLIVGGLDRGINYSELIQYLNQSSVKNIVCLPSTGHKIGKEITNPEMNVFIVDTMEEAVRIAQKHTIKNTICLLSPAAASYGYFKNFEDRGDQFKKFVTSIQH